MNKLIHLLFTKTIGINLYLFRILFGFVLIYQTYYYIDIDYVFQFITGPELLFKYPYLEFLEPLPFSFLLVIQWAMLFFAILFMLGIMYRISAIFLLAWFAYFTFIDTTLYNNHLYLFILLLLIMATVPADKGLSLSAFMSKAPSIERYTIFNWQIFLPKFIILLCYFFGGIAKLNSDWLDLSLPSIIVESSPLDYYTQIITPLIAYGGILFDIGIVFLLLKERYFIISAILIVVFNLLNGLVLFNDIGVFPLFMVLSTSLFIPTTILNKWGFGIKKAEISLPKRKHQWRITTLFIIFIVAQLIIPIRHFFLTSNPEWTGVASRFIWHMKLQSKSVEKFDMFISDGLEGKPIEVDYSSFLSLNQKNNLLIDPNCILQLGRHVAKIAKKQGMVQPFVKADIWVSYNGRIPQQMINSKIDISDVKYTRNNYNDWLIPLVSKI